MNHLIEKARAAEDQRRAEEIVKAAGDRLLVMEFYGLGQVGLVRKARHALRDADTGRFRPMSDHVDNIPDDSEPLPIFHSGAVLAALLTRIPNRD